MSWFVYVVKLKAPYHRDDVISGLAEKGIPARAYFSGIHTQAFLKDIVAKQNVHVPVTDEVQNRTFALPFHNKLTAEECQQVVRALNEVLATLAKKQAA
jgi:dTDP-4-amino-4,6-dideoxygalactose transaminase